MEIDGKKIAAELFEELKKKPRPKKYLAAVLCGENEASKKFVLNKKKAAEDLGLDFRIYELPADLSQDDLRKKVGEIANHSTCGGVVVQLPLPEGINKQYVLNVIPPEKDPDVLGERAMGAFCAGRSRVLPPAVGVLKEIFERLKIKEEERIFAVVGLGFLIGRPSAIWLMNKAKEIILLDKGSDLNELKKADVVICGAGQAGLIKAENLKDGAIVIDFGFSLKEGLIMGDLDKDAFSKLDNYTPTPGGTGPILVAKLLENFFELNAD